MTKVLLIGLDGATWDLIMPWIDEGRLPTLRRLLTRGVYGELESTIPPNTIPAWDSLAAGKNPGELGYFSWLTKRERSYGFEPTFLYAKNRTVWDILSSIGKKTMILNVPNVHKATKINGCMVAGFLYFSQENLTYPKNLKKRLDDITGGYEVDPIEGVLDTYQRNRAAGDPFGDTLANARAMNDSEYLKKIYRVMDKHFKAFKFLLKRQWDFAFIVFVATDRIQHRFWNDRSALLECYERVDDKLGRILDAVDKTATVIVVSDHGFGPKKRVLCLSEWLVRNGYLHLKRGVPNESRVLKFMAKIGISKLLKPLARYAPSKIRLFLEKKAVFRIDLDKIDWEKTTAFASPVSSAGEIYLNVCGREEKGIINPEKYEETREEIRQKLMNLRDPKTGEKLSAKVYNREEVYQGKYLDRAPDLVVLQDDNINAFDVLVGRHQIFLETSGEVGHHRINGIFIASGPNVRNGEKIAGARICDIAPTILHIFGIAPGNMDGRVLEEIFSTDVHAKPEKKEAKHLSQEEVQSHTASDLEDEKRILNRLRRLGYL